MSTFFAKHNDTLMEPLERRLLDHLRGKLLRGARGHVLEIGSGTGANFPYYAEADKVTAIEPNALMRERSLMRAAGSPVPVEVLQADAERLPFPDNCFDTAAGTLVLCTIPRPEEALREIYRVTRAGGKILLLEHVRLDQPLLAGLQDWLTPIWRRLCDGCHLNRDTVGLVKAMGFRVVRTEWHVGKLFVMIEAEKP